MKNTLRLEDFAKKIADGERDFVGVHVTPNSSLNAESTYAAAVIRDALATSTEPLNVRDASVYADLSGCNLRGMQGSRMHLGGSIARANLTDASLRSARITDLQAREALIKDTDLAYSIMQNADFRNTAVEQAVHTLWKNVKLQNATMGRTDNSLFVDCNLSGTNYRAIDGLQGVRFVDCDTTGAYVTMPRCRPEDLIKAVGSAGPFTLQDYVSRELGKLFPMDNKPTIR